jgi:uncharacterized membrane protein
MTASQSRSPVQRGRRYRRSIIGLAAVGVAALLVGMAVGESLAGLVVYALAVVGMFGILAYAQVSDSVALGDERENRLERRASHLTFQLFGYAGLCVFVAMFLLDAVGRYEFGGAAEPLLYAFSVVSLTWGGIYLLLRYRS